MLVGQTKSDSGGGLNFHRFTVEQIGFILPLRNGLRCRFYQERFPAPQMNFRHPAISSDYDPEYNITLNTRSFRTRRKVRFNFL